MIERDYETRTRITNKRCDSPDNFSKKCNLSVTCTKDEVAPQKDLDYLLRLKI